MCGPNFLNSDLRILKERIWVSVHSPFIRFWEHLWRDLDLEWGVQGSTCAAEEEFIWRISLNATWVWRMNLYCSPKTSLYLLRTQKSANRTSTAENNITLSFELIKILEGRTSRRGKDTDLLTQLTCVEVFSDAQSGWLDKGQDPIGRQVDFFRFFRE